MRFFLGAWFFTGYFPWGDCSDMCVICGGSSGVVLGGRAGWRKRIARFSGPGVLPSIRM